MNGLIDAAGSVAKDGDCRQHGKQPVYTLFQILRLATGGQIGLSRTWGAFVDVMIIVQLAAHVIG